MSMDPEIAVARANALTKEDIAEIADSRANPDKNKVEIEPVGYDLKMEKMNQILDALNVLQLTVRQIAGGKVKKSDFKPSPRPKTAYQRAVDKLVLDYEKEYQEEAMSDFGF